MELVKENNNILRQKLISIDSINDEIKFLIKKMEEIMISSNGIGLAANQIGQNYQLFIIDKNLAQTNDVPSTFLNPEIVYLSKEQTTAEEGCLSLPEYWQNVTRSKKVKIKAIDDGGKKVPLSVKKGDVVIFTKYGPNEVKVGDKEYLIAKEDDILAIID